MNWREDDPFSARLYHRSELLGGYYLDPIVGGIETWWASKFDGLPTSRHATTGDAMRAMLAVIAAVEELARK